MSSKWDTGDKRQLQRQLETYERTVDARLSTLELKVVPILGAGRGTVELRAGQYADVDLQSERTITLVAPGTNSIWRNVIIRKRDNDFDLTVKAVGCRLNGATNGTLIASNACMIFIQVVPSVDGSAEWYWHKI